jgi:Domain of unknown function (DUF4397)
MMAFMKRIVIVFSVVLLAIAACNKQILTNSRLSVFNGTHSINGLSVKWNGDLVTTSPLVQGQFSGSTGTIYTNIAAGTNNIVVQNGTNLLLDKNIFSEPLGAYTLLACDTNNTAGSTRLLYLTDNIINTIETDTAHIRFLNLVPGNPAVDVILLRPAKNDTAFINQPFVGKEADEKNIEIFSQKKAGQVSAVRINKTGTNENLISVGSYNFEKKSFYTIIFSGLGSGTGNAGLQLKILKH